MSTPRVSNDEQAYEHYKALCKSARMLPLKFEAWKDLCKMMVEKLPAADWSGCIPEVDRK